MSSVEQKKKRDESPDPHRRSRSRSRSRERNGKSSDDHQKIWKCDKCDESFIWLGDLHQHQSQNVHKGEKVQEKDEKSENVFKFECDICAIKYQHLKTLKRHIQSTHNIDQNMKFFKCTVCEHKSKSQYDLKQHMYIHTDERPYKCLTCDASFTQNSNLKRHIQRKHTVATNTENFDEFKLFIPKPKFKIMYRKLL